METLEQPLESWAQLVKQCGLTCENGVTTELRSPNHS